MRASSSRCWSRTPFIHAEVFGGVFVTGKIPQQNTFEDTGGPFFRAPVGAHPDPWLDDQVLCSDTDDGLEIRLGCAHSGVVNTLEYVQHLTGGRPIHSIVGGLHLLEASPERMDKTIAAFRRLDIQRLAPAHCTPAYPPSPSSGPPSEGVALHAPSPPLCHSKDSATAGAIAILADEEPPRVPSPVQPSVCQCPALRSTLAGTRDH